MPPFVVHHVRPDSGSPQVVLLHGVYADHHLWDPVIALLDELDIVALDGPGHGSATRTSPLPPLQVQVEHLATSLREHVATPAVLAGHSWGGMLALRLAVSHPELVSGLLLTNTPLLRTRGPGRIGFRTQRALLLAGLSPGRYGGIAAAALYGRDHRSRHPEVIAETARTVAALGRRGTIEIIDRVLLQPAGATELLTRLTVPTVLVAGEQDYVGSPDVRVEVAAAGHELRSHPGGHMGPREAPEHLARLLRDLVDAAHVHHGRTTT